jgi:hypothetical protein
VPVDVVFASTRAYRRLEIDMEWREVPVGTSKHDDAIGSGEDRLEMGLDVVSAVDFFGETKTAAVLIIEYAVGQAILRPQVPVTA